MTCYSEWIRYQCVFKTGHRQHRNQHEKNSSVAFNESGEDASMGVIRTVFICRDSERDTSKIRPTWRAWEFLCTEFSDNVPLHRPRTWSAASHPKTVEITPECPTSNEDPLEESKKDNCIVVTVQNCANRTDCVDNAQEHSTITPCGSSERTCQSLF